MEPTLPIEHPTWVEDIQFFFTEKDKVCMLNTDNPIDLDSYKEVARLANKIYNVVESGWMPMGGPEWSEEKKETFYNWYEDGCPFGLHVEARIEFVSPRVSRIRKNVNDLTPEEEQVLIRAFEGIMARDKDHPQGYYQLAGIHGFPNSYCEHHSNQYNPWHRFYTNQFEDALRSVPGCEAVTLPYWDITEPSFPALFNKAPFKNYTLPVTPSPIPNYIFPDPYTTLRLPNSDILSNIQLLGIEGQITYALNEDTWEDFHGWINGDRANAIIPAHDNGHVTFGHPELGGIWSTLMIQHVAAFEPLFWFFHCNWDRLWWEWQKKYNATTVEGVKNRIKGSKKWLDRKIVPFNKTPAESIDLSKMELVDGIGVDYESSQIPLSMPELARARGSMMATGSSTIKSANTMSVMIKRVNRMQIPGTFLLSLKSDEEVIGRQFFFQNSNPPTCANCVKMPLVNFNFLVDTDQVVGRKLEVEIKDMAGNLVPLIKVGMPSINARLLLEREI